METSLVKNGIGKQRLPRGGDAMNAMQTQCPIPQAEITKGA
jgi:hypothetical protein